MSPEILLTIAGTVIILLLGVISFFLSNLFSKVEVTSNAVIQLQTQVEGMKSEIGKISVSREDIARLVAEGGKQELRITSAHSRIDEMKVEVKELRTEVRDC